MIDQKHFSAEQIDFLDKFFKENPWAESAQIESIVKETGLTETMIKAYLEQRRAKWNSMYSSNGYLNYSTNEFPNDIPIQPSFHHTHQPFLGHNSMKNEFELGSTRMFATLSFSRFVFYSFELFFRIQ